MRTTLAFLLLTTPLLAQEPLAQHLKNGVAVYKADVYNKLPDFVYDMTNEQWFNWATHQNEQMLQSHHLAAYPTSDRLRYKYVTERSHSSQTRFGGGVGYGGFGGSGGYAGYLGALDQPSVGFGGGFGGFRYGAGRPGNSVQTKSASSVQNYALEFHEWPAFNGGDVPLLNPYAKPHRPMKGR